MPNLKLAMVLPFFLFMLFFTVFPWFSDVNTLAKVFFFYFFSLAAFLYTVLKKSSMYLDASFPHWVLLFAGFVLSALGSKDPASAFLFVAMVFSVALFFFWSTDLKRTLTATAEGMMQAILLLSLLFAMLGLGQFCDYAINGPPSHMVIPYLLPASWWPRLSGPFGQPNFHALLMVTGLCAHAYLLCSQTWESRSFWIKTGFFLPAGLLWVNFFLADSRGGKVGLGMLLVILVWFLYRNGARFRVRNFLLRGLCSVVVALLAWGVAKTMVIGSVAGGSLSALEVAQSGSIASRINTWTSSLLMFAEHPFFGIGPDNFKGYLYGYQVKANELLHFEYEDMIYTRWAHNEYLQILAEGGLFVFGPLLVLLFSIGRRIFTNLKSANNLKRVFLYLSPIPFLVQAAFDWPLRFPPLLALFLALVAFSLPCGKDIEILLTPWRKRGLTFLLLLFLGGGIWGAYWECQVGFLKSAISDEALLDENFKRLLELADNPVVEFTVHNQGVLPFVGYALKNRDADLANALLPLLERGIDLEGAYWQWYNKARILLVAGKEAEAKVAIRKTLDLNPVYGPAWQFLHHLDVLNASRVLGRPVESFYSAEANSLELPDVGDFSTNH